MAVIRKARWYMTAILDRMARLYGGLQIDTIIENTGH
jgi:hypothetical protein